jgi:hypothetical protein
MTDMTLIEFGQGMRQHFGIKDSRPYLDPVGVMTRQIQLDPLAFDDWLHQQHGEYEDERHLSMAMLITEEYGTAAHDWTRRAMGLPAQGADHDAGAVHAGYCKCL